MTVIEKQIDILLRKARTAIGELSLQAIRLEKQGRSAKNIRQKMFLILALVDAIAIPVSTLTEKQRYWLAADMAGFLDLHGYAISSGNCWVKTYVPKTDSTSGGFSFPISGSNVIVFVNGSTITVQQAISYLYSQKTGANYIKISGGTI